jgi:hypothetical protein
VLAAAAAATVAVAVASPATHRRADDLRTLVETLRQRGITRVYSGYWTCNLITFLSREDTVCAALDDQLHPGQDRYLPYRAAVAASDRPAYVAPESTPLDAAVGAAVYRSDPGAEVFTVAGYRVYRPRAPLPVD